MAIATRLTVCSASDIPILLARFEAVPRTSKLAAAVSRAGGFGIIGGGYGDETWLRAGNGCRRRCAHRRGLHHLEHGEADAAARPGAGTAAGR